RRERHDLHELFLTQLPAHRAEDARGARLALLGDEHGSVLVEADVGAVLALGLLGRAHDHRPHHLPLLDLARGDGVLDRDHDDVSQPAVAPLRPAEHADHERAARARIVRDLENRFLLDHGPSLLSGPPPPLLRHVPFLSRRMVLMRAISRRMARNWSGLAIASVPRRNASRKRSSASTASFCSSSSVLSSRNCSGFCGFAILALLPPHEL